jgi:prolyl oligopeptidase
VRGTIPPAVKMKGPSLSLSPALALVLAGAALAGSAPETKLSYPKAPTTDQVDDYHGTKVTDLYRPLENPDAPESRAWIEAENALTEGYLKQIPERAKIRERLVKLWNYERYSTPFRMGSRLFYSRNDGLQNQSVLYVVDKPGAEARMLLDPNTLSKDGTVALSGIRVSDDGRLMAFGVAAAGSDWNEWRVLDVASGRETGDILKWIKFSGAAWTKDGTGFYYTCYDQPPTGHELDALSKSPKVRYHELGTRQAEDPLVFSKPDEPEISLNAVVSDDGRWLVLYLRKGSDRRNRLYTRDLSRPDSDFVKLFDQADASYNFVDSQGTTFFIRTDKDAPRRRVVAVDVAPAVATGRPVLRDVIPQTDVVIEAVHVVGGRFAVTILKDATERARLYSLHGKLEKEIELPTLGQVSGFDGKRSDTETYYAFTSFTYPTTIYRYDFRAGKSELFRQPKVDFDPAGFETKQVFYPSRDGTRIPLFLVSKKGLVPNGQNPTYLWGYGGFNVSMTPSFSIRNLAFVEMGGLYAHVCLRGGGEYGEEWHRAGMLDRKQNVFDDFAAAAEWLVGNKYTSTKRLAIGGGSNGGLLVGATLNQHPDLFGAAVPAVGVMDMLRFQRFTIGWAWVSDYGSADNPEQFKWLYAYSPLHNIKPGTKYPPVLVTTADHDDRVVPAHSFKYTAALQAAQGGDAPILIRIETRAGHGAGKPTSKQIDEATDVLTFLTKTLGGLKP